jgi:hypothetical protein
MNICRDDVVAARVFVEALTPETTEEMKKEIISIAIQAKDRPDPTTRIGLALIAFTTLGNEVPSDDELIEARERVASLWTQEEKERASRK